MEASDFTKSEQDEREEGDVWSDLETLKKLYGLLDKSAGINSESKNEQLLDHKSRIFLLKLLDEATQHILVRQLKMLPGSPFIPRLANTASFQRLERTHDEDFEQKLNSSLRNSFQRRDSNLLKSQVSMKSRKSQAHHAPTQVPSYPFPSTSWYHGPSSIDGSSKHPIGRSPMYQYHKENSLYCPSDHCSSSSGYKTAELAQKRIYVSPKDPTNSTRLRLGAVSSRSKQMNWPGALYKTKIQNMRPKKSISTDGTTPSGESNNKTLDHTRMSKFDKWAPHHRRLPPIDRRKKSCDNLSANTTGKSNSVTSCDSCGTSMESLSPKRKSSTSSSSSRRRGGALPIIPFQKPTHYLVPTRPKKPLNSLHEHKPLQRIRSSRRKSASSGKKPRDPSEVSHKIRTPEPKTGRFKGLKDKLAIVLHLCHDHNHYHHHPRNSDSSRKGGANKDHQHRSPWKYLKGVLHRSSEQAAEIVPSQHHHHRHMRKLFRMLFSHLWGNKRKKARLGRTVSRVRVKKKLHWWQKLKRGARMKLTVGKKARLRLRYAPPAGSMRKGKRK